MADALDIHARPHTLAYRAGVYVLAALLAFSLAVPPRRAYAAVGVDDVAAVAFVSLATAVTGCKIASSGADFVPSCVNALQDFEVKNGAVWFAVWSTIQTKSVNGVLRLADLGNSAISSIQEWCKGYADSQRSIGATLPDTMTVNMPAAPGYAAAYTFTYTFSDSEKAFFSNAVALHPYFVVVPVYHKAQGTYSLLMAFYDSEADRASSLGQPYDFMGVPSYRFYSKNFNENLYGGTAGIKVAESFGNFRISFPASLYKQFVGGGLSVISGAPSGLASDVLAGKVDAGQAIDACPNVNVEPTAIDNYGDVTGTAQTGSDSVIDGIGSIGHSLTGIGNDVLAGVRGLTDTLTGIGSDVISGVKSLAGTVSGAITNASTLVDSLVDAISATLTATPLKPPDDPDTPNLQSSAADLAAFTPVFLIVYLKDFLVAIFK